MDYVLSDIFKTACILLLVVMGMATAGRLAACRHWRFWLLIPFAPIGVMMVCRYVPSMQAVKLFDFIMAGRREFVIGAYVIPVLLLTPMHHFETRRQKLILLSGSVCVVSYFSILPFLAPLFEIENQSAMVTVVDQDGVCLQSTAYNCGPAAAVTVLRSYGLPAEEGRLALAARTNRFAGTPPDVLCHAIFEIYGTACEVTYEDDLERLTGRVPFLAVVKFAPMIDHYVAVMNISDEHILVGDPLFGARVWTRNEFINRWRRKNIIVRI